MCLMHARTQAGGLLKPRGRPSAWSRYGDPKAEADTKVTLKLVLNGGDLQGCRKHCVKNKKPNKSATTSDILLVYI